jgi:tRNA A-37 threonylcarbamoyl transferase component Bud32
MPEPYDAAPSGLRLGKYEIVQRIAYGGMAEIYLARASGIEGFEKVVVLKRILPQYAADREFVQMFLREARLAATLDQANIAHVYDIGEEGGSYFYTMEYLHGQDVRGIMRTLKRRDQRLPLEHAIGIVMGAASGLHYAHEKKGPDGRGLGIVHRDVSPSNIVVTFDGGVKVVDFGIAKASADPDLSKGYSFKGKLTYISPEQMNTRSLDRRSDVFSLGVVLYEITTHRRLYNGTTDIEVVRQMLEGGIPRPTQHSPGYPPDLEAIVMRALETDPERRYPTARAMQRDLEAFARNHGVHVSSTALAEWMEATFGAGREAWHERTPGAVTPMTAREPLQKGPGEDGAPTKALRRAPSVSIPPPVEVAPPPPQTVRRGPRLFAVAALLVAAALTGVGVARRRQLVARVAAGARPAPPVVMLVAEGGHVAIEHGEAPAPPPAAPPAPLPAPAAAPPADLPHARPGRGSHRHGSATTGRAPDFSASLARRERELRACFEEAGAQAADGAGEIAFRFQIRADGHVASVDVLPESVGSTRVGACLRRVAAGTVFAPQPQPVTFRIPVSLKVRLDGKTPR